MSRGPERPVSAIAYDHFTAGRYADAATLYARLLEQNPDDAQALLFLGSIHVNDGKLASAEQYFRHGLDVDPAGPLAALALHNLGGIRQRCGDDEAAIELFERSLARKADFAPTFNDLGASLHRLGRNKDALAAFERAVLLDSAYVTALRNWGLVLSRTGQNAKAVEILHRAADLAPHDPEILTQFGLAHLKLENFEQAETAFRRALALDPSIVDLLFHLGEAVDGRHRTKEAEQYFEEWARRTGTVVKTCACGQPKARILVLAGAYPCNTPTQYLFSADRFETIILYLSASSPNGNIAHDPSQFPEFDLVFNAVSDADGGSRFLGQVEEICARLDRPILNPPHRIPETRRDRIASRLSGIPQLAIPRTRRMSRAELVASLSLADFYARPLLIRPVGSHGGHGLRKVDHAWELAAYLGEMSFDDFYVSDFCDYRSNDGYYRKYRFIFIDREVYPYHLGISDDWLIHYWRTDMNRIDRKREEEAFLADYRSAFPGVSTQVISEIARRVDLDYAGMDCGITADGRVLLFELNATMLVHLDDCRENFPYKHVYLPKIFDGIDRLVARRLHH